MVRPPHIEHLNDPSLTKYTIIVCPCGLQGFHYRVWEPKITWSYWAFTGSWKECLEYVLNKIRISPKENQEELC